MAKKTTTKKPASKASAKKSPSSAPKPKAAPKSKAPAKSAAKASSGKAATATTKKSAKAPAKSAATGDAAATKPSRPSRSKKATGATEAATTAKSAKATKAAAAAAVKEAKKAASEVAAAAKAATAAAKAATKAAGSKKSKSGSKSGGSAKKPVATNADGSVTPAFLTEPGPRFRSPFSGSASTAKEAAKRMAEAAGLTAIRAASPTRAPTLKKFKKITASPLPDKQLEEFRVLLTEKRDQLVGDVSSMEREALGGDGGSLSRLPQHMADQGTDTYDQSLNLDLAASQRSIVKEIDAALARIVAKTFGVCELLGKPIGIDRLRNAPWTRYSIEAARMLELNPELARVGAGGSDDDEDGDDEV